QEIDRPKDLKEENARMLPTIAEEKDDDSDIYNNEGLGPEKETTEEYYEWMEKLNQKFERVLIWSEHDAMEESWGSGVEFSDSESDWDNDWPSKTLLDTNEVWRDLEEDDDSNHDKESKSEEGLKNRLSEEVIKKLNEYRSRASCRGPLMSPFPDPTEKEFCIEEYNEELKKQEVVLDVLMEVEAEFIRNSTPRKKGVEAWYHSTGKEEMTLITEEENEVFVIFVSDDNDDKTVQGEEDLPKLLPDTVNEQIPRTISI
ncbi:4214_t:CDS:2, partial [Gigaspora margarita]